MRQIHVAGERMFVLRRPRLADRGVDHDERRASMFVAVLSASNYTYAEASWTQGLSDWIGSHTRSFAFFGGVPATVVLIICPGTETVLGINSCDWLLCLPLVIKWMIWIEGSRLQADDRLYRSSQHILLFDPRREYSSAPTAFLSHRRAQRRSRMAALFAATRRACPCMGPSKSSTISRHSLLSSFQFLCSTRNPVSSPRPTRVGSRRAQGQSRPAVALR